MTSEIEEPPFLIRRLTPADVAEYRRLRLFGHREAPFAFGKTYAEEARFPISELQQRLHNSAESWVLGAWAGSKLVGTIRLIRNTSFKERHKANIYGMYVAPRWRKQGVGRGLLAFAIEIARGMRGLQQVHLTAAAANRPALRLYTSVGFVSYGEEPRALFDGSRYNAEQLLCLQLRRAKPAKRRRSVA